MKEIKIFLASSEELDSERNAFGNLVRRLDKIYEKRGVRISLFEWEDYDAAYNDRRKQEEYNDQVRASDLFLALFHTKAGKFTVEEFDVATEEFRKHALPKVYAYCKDLAEGEREEPELTEFKRRLFEEMGHYWCRYNNRESMQFHFVMQLQLFESSNMEDLKVEEGNVTLDGHTVARMDQLRFFADNEEMQKMSRRLVELPEKIAKARARLEKFPDDEDLLDDLQALLNEYNALKKTFADEQKQLFNLAKRVAQLQGEVITDRMRRAIDAFEEGRIHEANVILDEAEHDADRHLADYRQSKEITEQKRQLVLNSIDELSLKADTTLADAILAIEERITLVSAQYAKADSLAQEANYEKRKYCNLLFRYGVFLDEYGRYEEAKNVYLRQIALSEELYGQEHSDTADSYNNVGIVYADHGDYDKALEYLTKSLVLKEKALGKEHPDAATLYNNIGNVYDDLGEYNKALEYHFKALDVKEKTLGNEHPDTADSYNNVGLVCDNLGDYDKALEYHFKALAIYEEVLGKEHPATAGSYGNIGLVFNDQGCYDKALQYLTKALVIKEKTLGKGHPDTASSYNNIGIVYKNQGEYDKALEYYNKALGGYRQTLGDNHPLTKKVQENIDELQQYIAP